MGLSKELLFIIVTWGAAKIRPVKFGGQEKISNCGSKSQILLKRFSLKSKTSDYFSDIQLWWSQFCSSLRFIQRGTVSLCRSKVSKAMSFQSWRFQKRFCHLGRVEPHTNSKSLSPRWWDHIQKLTDHNFAAPWPTVTQNTSL